MDQGGVKERMESRREEQIRGDGEEERNMHEERGGGEEHA